MEEAHGAAGLLTRQVLSKRFEATRSGRGNPTNPMMDLHHREIVLAYLNKDNETRTAVDFGTTTFQGQ